MSNTIYELKKLNAAYIAAQEYDRCPDGEEAVSVNKLFDTGISLDALVAALNDNQGRRPDEIAGEISELIKTL